MKNHTAIATTDVDAIVFGAEFNLWILVTRGLTLERLADARDAVTNTRRIALNSAKKADLHKYVKAQMMVEELTIAKTELDILAAHVPDASLDYADDLVVDYFDSYLMAYGRSAEWRDSGLTLQDVAAAY